MYKYLVILLLLTGCYRSPDADLGPYPGKTLSDNKCKRLWTNGWKIDVNKCENHINNPKFKRGQTVYFAHYSKYCHLIIERATYFAGNNINGYYVTQKCSELDDIKNEPIEEDSLVKNYVSRKHRTKNCN